MSKHHIHQGVDMMARADDPKVSELKLHTAMKIETGRAGPSTVPRVQR